MLKLIKDKRVWLIGLVLFIAGIFAGLFFVTSEKKTSTTVQIDSSNKFSFDLTSAKVNSSGVSLLKKQDTEMIAYEGIEIPEKYSLSSFTQENSQEQKPDIKYQLTSDMKYWYFFDGSKWKKASGCNSCTNSAEEINQNIKSFPVSGNQLKIKIFISKNNELEKPLIKSIGITLIKKEILWDQLTSNFNAKNTAQAKVDQKILGIEDDSSKEDEEENEEDEKYYDEDDIEKESKDDDIIPILECVEYNEDKTYTAYFGYRNKKDAKIIINKKSEYNSFKESDDDGSSENRPEEFSTGRQYYVFSVKFNKKLKWKLFKSDIEADKDSTKCTRPPSVNEDQATTAYNTPINISVLANDSANDSSFDLSTLIVTTNPQHGSITKDTDTGIITYTPTSNYSGTDFFVYKICNINNQCAQTTVNITVLAPPSPTPVSSFNIAICLDGNIGQQATGFRFGYMSTNIPSGTNPTRNTLSLVGSPTGPVFNWTTTNRVWESTPRSLQNYNIVWTLTVLGVTKTTTSPIINSSNSIVGSAIGQCPVSVTPTPINYQNITAKSLSGYSCDQSEWHFVITQVDTEAQAPNIIRVTWQDNSFEDIELSKYTGKTAHYSTTTNLDKPVISGTASIYTAWSGEFNLSHGPCTFVTPTPTPTPTSTPTPTATTTATSTPTSSPTSTPTATSTPTSTPTPTATSTSTPTPTGTATSTPTSSPTATTTPTNTSSPTPTATSTTTPTQTATPTSTSTPTTSPTTTVTATATSTPTSSPTVIPSPTPTPSILVSDDFANTDYQKPITVNVVLNDETTGGELLNSTITITQGPNNGVLTINTNGSITYTPKNGFSGNDSFKYQICNTVNLCSIATVLITVGEPPLVVAPIPVDTPTPTQPSSITPQTFAVNIDNSVCNTKVTGNLLKFSGTTTLKITNIGDIEYSVNTDSWNPITNLVSVTKGTNFSGSISIFNAGERNLKIRVKSLSGEIVSTSSCKIDFAQNILIGANQFNSDNTPSILDNSGRVYFIKDIPQNFAVEVIGATKVQVFDDRNNFLQDLKFNPDSYLWEGSLKFSQAQSEKQLAVIAQNSLSKKERLINYVVVDEQPKLTDSDNNPVSEYITTVYSKSADGKRFNLWNGEEFGQSNPRKVSDGLISLLLPAGEFYVVVESPGYQTATSLITRVDKLSYVTADIKMTKSQNPLSQFIGLFGSSQINNFPLKVHTSNFVNNTIKNDVSGLQLKSTLDNSTTSLKALTSKKSVLLVYSTWGDIANQQVLNFEDLSEKYNDKYSFVMISTLEPENVTKNYVKRGNYKIAYYSPVETQSFFDTLNINSLPMVLLIEDGKVIGYSIDLANKDILEKFIQDNYK